MNIRQCTKCKEDFDADSIKNKRHKSRCNECHLEYKRKWRDSRNPKNKLKKELAKQNKKQCTKCNEIKELENFWKSKKGYLGVKSECNKCSSIYGEKFIEYNKNRDKTPKAIEYRKNYIKENKDKWRKYEREYRKQKRANDPFYKIKMNISSRISDIIRGKTSRIRTMELLGCSREEFINYIELKFIDGMNWENYGKKGWQVDHIKPVSLFNLLDEKELRLCFHYTNLQPLWWYDNLKKFNNYN